MKTMFLISVFFSFHVFASQKTTIDLSPTFQLIIPYEIKQKVDLSSLNSKVVDIARNSKPVQIFMVHNKPTTLANKFSVERYWKESRQQTAIIDKNENNHGCKRLTSRTFECSREVTQSDKNVSEKIFWNIDKDLVLIRVTAFQAPKDLNDILQSIKISANSRLPAGGKR